MRWLSIPFTLLLALGCSDERDAEPDQARVYVMNGLTGSCETEGGNYQHLALEIDDENWRYEIWWFGIFDVDDGDHTVRTYIRSLERLSLDTRISIFLEAPRLRTR